MYIHTYMEIQVPLYIHMLDMYIISGKGTQENKVHLAATYGYFHPTRTQPKGEGRLPQGQHSGATL